MTDQRDRDRRRPSDYVRRDDGTWNVLPIILGVAVLALIGYFVFGPGFNTRTDRPVTGQRMEAPDRGVNAPTPTPAKPQ
jgi:hypothetical protein